MVEYSRDSSFNMGIAHLVRIDAILYDIAEASSEEDYVSWHKNLNILCREVFFLFTPQEMKDNCELDNKCVKSITEYLREKTYEKKVVAYNDLVNYEFFIKQQLASRKMLMAFNRDVRTSIADLG